MFNTFNFMAINRILGGHITLPYPIGVLSLIGSGCSQRYKQIRISRKDISSVHV